VLLHDAVQPALQWPISIAATTPLKFLAVKTAGPNAGGISPIAAAPYTIAAAIDSVAPTVTANPIAGTYTNAQSVTLNADEPATLYYTVDGSAPTTASSKYSGPVAVDTSLTLKVLAVDNVGNQSNTSFADVIQSPKAPGAPTQTIAVPDKVAVNATLANSTLPVKIQWTPSSSTTVDHYELQQGGDGVTFANAALPSPTATAITANLVMGTTAAPKTYAFRVRACGTADGTACSAWATGPKFTLQPVDDSSIPAAQYKGKWTTENLAGAYGGTVHWTAGSGNVQPANQVQFSINGNAAWVSTLGPDNGLAQVQVDNGTPQVVDLYSPTVQPAQVVWTVGGLAPGAHTVTVTVLGKKSTLNLAPCNTGNKCARVDIDMAAIIK
jgi:hypothetical protein